MGVGGGVVWWKWCGWWIEGSWGGWWEESRAFGVCWVDLGGFGWVGVKGVIVGCRGWGGGVWGWGEGRWGG